MKLKKNVISTIIVILLLISVYFAYTYYNGPKIIEAVVSKSIDDNGRPISITTKFSPEDIVCFAAKGNRFWVKEAQVVWYKGKVETANRFLVEEDIVINDAGYFSTKLSVPEGLEEGHYSVSVYVNGRDVIETHTEFDVKR